VIVFFAINEYWTDEIMEELWYLGIDSQNAERAYENLSSGELNTGLCYSNFHKRMSVIVISKTSSAAELFNSTMHEFKHLSSHIAKACHLQETGEDIAYATGELAHDMWGYVQHLFCDHCRCKTKYNHYERDN
jgi:hypothetical protein